MHFVGCLNFEDPCSMKYPPVVSTLEEWLDGKLGIQGIDAVSCAFYVLSLLQRDETNEPESYYQFPCSKIVDDQGLSYWPQNSWSNWGFDCYENSLAAKCVSAPVQRYEIEHLGNDLSPSLKSVKSEGGDCMTQGCLCDKQCFSLPVEDQVKRCQKVFSVGGQRLNEEEKCKKNSVAVCKNTLWANESACVGFFKHKLEGGGLEEKNNFSFMAEKPVHEKGEGFWMADTTETGNNLFLHDEKLLWDKKDEGFFSWKTLDDKSSTGVEEIFKHDEYSDGIQDVWEPDLFGKQAKSRATVSMPHVGAGAKYGIQGLSESSDEDVNLAQLIAKFDHSIEAIWNLGSTRPLSYGATDEQQNLPWSFHNFVSPSQDAVKMDQNSFENNLDSSSEENSFIHSGTNIVNSIWSDQPFLSNSTSQESGVKYVGGGVSDFNNSINDDHSDLCCKLKVLLTTDEILHNEFNLFEWNSGTSETRIEVPKHTNENCLQEVPECSNVLWDKIQSFPTLFSNVNFQEQFCRMENFQDADCENQQNENSCMISCSSPSISCFQGSCQDNVQDTADDGKRNFSTLNHNREDSSFTEVLPRHAGTNKLYQEIKIGNSCTSESGPVNDATDQSCDENKSNLDTTGKEEEEDLLTSSRTHFRPIQQENQEPHNNPASSYADGTEFTISGIVAEVPFKRSESGTLYLDSDDVPGTPKKYMEYKEDRSGDLIKCVHISKDNLGNKEAFIPKFCVRQIEKCCQTDESDESSDELNFKRVKRDCAEKERKSNLFFSGDEIVKSVANYLDEDNSKFSSNEIGCKDNFDDERMDISMQNAKNDSVSRSLEAEMYIWNRAGCKCNNNYMFSSKSDSLRGFGASFLGEKEGLWEPASAARLCQSRYSIWSCSPGPQTEPCPVCETLTQDKTMQYSQLREELSEDGEQLLSDLSSLQPLQLSSGWLDDALDQSGWGTEPNLLTRVSSRRRLVSWGQCGEG
ncbi:hypothetical protein R5R35_013849 [Gryllus longicercus]|uniref:Uncharacterized protein n=1 Tax=Gryllus longicercus TaxID=2509291 RepID=A0AAN9VLI1_9ORTH